MDNEFYPFENLPLPYDYSAMEPYIDEKTMRLHHDRHLQSYIDNLNELLRNLPQLQQLPLDTLIHVSARLPHDIGVSLRNNAGGVYNHRFFFGGLKNPSESEPSGTLGDAINNQFGSFDAFRDAFRKAAMSVFGSGYAWLVLDRGKLRIVTTPNQNSPIEHNLCPILAADVWEHAYYLKHYNLRSDYIDDLMKIINWNAAEKNYLDCFRRR